MDRSNGNPDEATLTSLDGASKYAVREYQQELLEQARTENVLFLLDLPLITIASFVHCHDSFVCRSLCTWRQELVKL